ncbi:MAG: V-type ATP synthase subunit D [Methanobacterium sp.]|nr:V-type ATP synthase subunit D [Methanobacterium sp.]
MAQEMIEGINPTRMELLKLKDREKLAVKGHSLLKEKRNALIMEFFNILERVKGSREDVEKTLTEAYKDLTAAQIVMGDLAVKKAAMSVKEFVDVDIDSRSVMGVVVPVLDSDIHKRTMVERGYGFLDTSVKLDEAAHKFEESIKLIIELGEIEKTIILLAGEIESTKRRVNALEHIIIPKLENTVKYIEMRLEEMERENFVRLKMIKKTMEME